MDNNELLEAVSAALRHAGYTHVTTHTEASGALVTAGNDQASACFRIVHGAKPRTARTAAGGPEPQAAGLEVLVTPTMSEVRDHLRQHPLTAPAFGISAEMLEHVK